MTKLRALLALLIAASAASAENWPQWRGPFLDGSTTETGLPASWSATENVVWTAPLPGPGSSTPIVWGDRLFLSAVDKTSKAAVALCFHASSGKLLWNVRVAADRRLRNNNPAAPSAVTDGKVVIFTFGTTDIVGFDFEGKDLWARNLDKEFGEIVVQYGYSSSPLLYKGKLYVLVMQSKEPTAWGRKSDRKGPLDSFLLAIEPATGKTLWRQIRPTDAGEEAPETYNTPIPFEHDGRSEIVLMGGEYVTGHDPETGKELWRWEFSPHNREVWQRTVPSAVCGDGLVYVVRPQHRPVYALKGGGSGRLDDSWIAWRLEENTPDVACPLLYQGRLYVVEDGDKRVMTCLEPKTGKVVWQEKLGLGTVIRASPTGADGKIYVIDRNGEVVVLAAGDEFKVLSRAKMDERFCHASIAVAGGKLYLRTDQSLRCIAAAKP